MRECVETFLKRYHTLIDSAVDQTMQEVTLSGSDILTKGRQTFCPFQEQSVTAAQAYENAYNLFEANYVTDCHRLIGWVKGTLQCFEQENLYNTRVVEREIKTTVYDSETKQKVVSVKKKLVSRNMTTKNKEETRKRMQEIVCRFASYIKHKGARKIEGLSHQGQCC